MDRHLAKYLPPVFREFREFMAITGSEQPKVEQLYDETDRVLEEQFIGTAGEYGLSRWEKCLGILPKASETYGERRFRLTALMSSQLPYTKRALTKQLAQLCGADNYSVEIDVLGFYMNVFVALEVRSSYEVVKELLDKMVPANMEVYLSLKYNQNSMYYGMTHGELADFTHDQLRNEVFT